MLVAVRTPRTKLKTASKALAVDEHKYNAMIDIKLAIELHKTRIYNF